MVLAYSTDKSRSFYNPSTAISLPQLKAKLLAGEPRYFSCDKIREFLIPALVLCYESDIAHLQSAGGSICRKIRDAYPEDNETARKVSQASTSSSEPCEGPMLRLALITILNVSQYCSKICPFSELTSNCGRMSETNTKADYFL
jgi:hypothetical protein